MREAHYLQSNIVVGALNGLEQHAVAAFGHPHVRYTVLAAPGRPMRQDFIGRYACCCACTGERVLGTRQVACDRERERNLLIRLQAAPWGGTPGGARAPRSASVWCWPAALCMHAWTLTRECSAMSQSAWGNSTCSIDL